MIEPVNDNILNLVNELYNNLDAKDKIINEQALIIARLKEWKEDLLNENIELENIRKEAIEYIKELQNSCIVFSNIAYKELLEKLGDNNGK